MKQPTTRKDSNRKASQYLRLEEEQELERKSADSRPTNIGQNGTVTSQDINTSRTAEGNAGKIGTKKGRIRIPTSETEVASNSKVCDLKNTPRSVILQKTSTS